MLEIKTCPVCDDTNIRITHDNRTQQFKLNCNKCDKVYNLAIKVKIKCPICEIKDILFERKKLRVENVKQS